YDMEMFIPGCELFSAELFSYEPDQLANYLRSRLSELENEASAQGVSIDLVGEIGLDYFWLEKLLEIPEDLRHFVSDLDSLKQRSKSLQDAALRAQMEFAVARSLPVSLHSR